jgi:hypothetical protein
VEVERSEQPVTAAAPQAPGRVADYLDRFLARDSGVDAVHERALAAWRRGLATLRPARGRRGPG